MRAKGNKEREGKEKEEEHENLNMTSHSSQKKAPLTAISHHYQTVSVTNHGVKETEREGGRGAEG